MEMRLSTLLWMTMSLLLAYFGFVRYSEYDPWTTSKEKDELALDLIRAMNVRATMRTTTEVMAKNWPEEQRKAFDAVIDYDELSKKLAPVYKASFSKGEMVQMLNFLNSNAGKKFSDKQPEISRQTAEITEEYVKNKVEALKYFRR